MAIIDTERLYDIRTVHRHIREGRISEADYRAYLDALPDARDKARPPEETPVETALPSQTAAGGETAGAGASDEPAATGGDRSGTAAPGVPASPAAPGVPASPAAAEPAPAPGAGPTAPDFAAGWDLPDLDAPPTPATSANPTGSSADDGG